MARPRVETYLNARSEKAALSYHARPYLGSDPRPCPVCGQTFLPANGKQRCCSRECARAEPSELAKRAERTEVTRRANTVRCSVCAKEFVRRNRRQQYCSAECGHIASGERRRINNRARGYPKRNTTAA